MQRIERYGVIALVFLLVTILAVSLWGDKKGGSLFSFLKRKPRSIPSAVEPLSPGETDGSVAADRRSGTEGLPLSVPADQAAPSDQSGFAASQIGSQSAALSTPPPLVNYDPSAVRDGYSPGQLFGPVVGEPARVPALPSNQRDSLVSAAAASAPASVPSARSVHVVKPGETLGDIAMAHLGTWRRWTEISALNDNIEPSKLRAGMKLALPASARLAASVPSTPARSAPAAATDGRHKLQSGETLSKLAARYLGKADRWPEIAAANPGLDPNRLHVGTLIAIPGAGPLVAAQEARAQSATRQRTATQAEPQTSRPPVRALLAQADDSKRGRVR